jgi:hypothetical protein
MADAVPAKSPPAWSAVMVAKPSNKGFMMEAGNSGRFRMNGRLGTEPWGMVAHPETQLATASNTEGEI